MGVDTLGKLRGGVDTDIKEARIVLIVSRQGLDTGVEVKLQAVHRLLEVKLRWSVSDRSLQSLLGELR